MKNHYQTLNLKDSPSLYETPQAVAKLMVDLADIQPYDKVLEPSAGKGALLKEIDRKLYNRLTLTVCEMNIKNKEVLRSLGFRVWQTDFLRLNKEEQFDKILMNPPFKHDGNHILNAIKHLDSKGRLVALIHEQTIKKCWRFFYPEENENLTIKISTLSPSYFNNEFGAALIIIDKK